MSSKRFYWLKLKEDFFEQDAIKIIETMENGEKYINFYLKLLLKSISFNGVLKFKNTIPYTPKMLASITNTDIDTVKVAIGLFTDLGLMEQLDDGGLYMLEIENMVGSETAWAEKKRKQRVKGVDNVPLLSSESPDVVRQEIDREIDIDIDIDREIDISVLGKIEQAYFNTFYRQMSSTYIQKTLDIINKGDYSDLLIYALGLTKSRQKEQGKVKGYNYTLAIVESWINKGYKNKQDVEKNEIPQENQPSTTAYKPFDYSDT